MDTKSIELDKTHLKDYLHTLNKRKWPAIAFFVFTLSLFVAYLYSATPLYKATSRILVKKESPKVVDFEEVFKLDAPQIEYFQTQYEILKSRSLAQDVIKKLGLQQDPYYEGSADTAGKFINSLDIERVRHSMLIEVSAYHPRPEEAAKITDGLVSAYIRRNLDNKLQAAKQASDWIAGRMGELRSKVYESEKKIQEYKEKYQLISVPSVTEDNSKLRDLNAELIKLETTKAEYEKRYLEEHPKLIQVNNQINQVKAKMDEEIMMTFELNKVVIEYAQLERELESNTHIYESLLARLKETSVTENLEVSNVIVVDKAEVPRAPAKPNKALLLIVGLFLGFFGGAAIAFFIEYLDDSLKGPEDLERYLKLPFLGLIPQVPKSKKKEYPELFILNDSHSNSAESIKAIRTSLLFSSANEESQVIVITSSNPGEGKTVLSANLAIAFAQQKKKTLLIDADIRKPHQHLLFKLDNSAGLSNFLCDMGKPSVIHKTLVPNLDLITAGSVPPNPSELLGSPQLKKLIDKLKDDYDHIILDSSPFMSVTDANVLARVSDGAIFIVDTKKAHRKAVQRGKKMFISTGTSILGVVMNRVNIVREKYYYGNYHYYGYQHKKNKKIAD